MAFYTLRYTEKADMGICAALPLCQNVQFKILGGPFIIHSCSSEGKMWLNLLDYVSGGLTQSVFLRHLHPSDVNRCVSL